MAFNIRKRKTIRRVVFELSLIWLSVSIAFAASQEVHDADEVGDLKDGDIDLEEMRKLRRESKIWFARNIKVSGVEIPVSPVTAFTVSLVLFHVYMNWGTYAWCEASHILIKGHDDETVNKLKKMKKEIGNDLTKFQDMAKQHSACPSGNKGGSLGRYYRGDMAKNFDKASFDPNVPLKTTVGPFETSFGWHLLYIHERKM